MVSDMNQPADVNAAIWQSSEMAQTWTAEAAEREQRNAAPWRFMTVLLPFGEQETFTFLDLGAGPGGLSRVILGAYPNSTAVLADFSAVMMGAGAREMEPFAGRYQYVEFDLQTGGWPASVPASVDAVVSSMFVHHLTDERKRGLFAEIFDRLVPAGWYLNYDPVRIDDPVVAEACQHASDWRDPHLAHKRTHRTPEEQARWDNHVRHMIPLAPQLEYLRLAGFEGVDVYWKRLDFVIYGGRRPPAPDSASSPG
jgi:tRNA (cmo5U34)-methyltransferase